MALLRGLKRGLERSAQQGLQVPGDTTPPDFTGTLPATIGALSGWTGTAAWTVGFNFKDAAGASVSCASMTGGASMTVAKLTNNPTLLAAPQAGWASQGGISVAAANELLFTADSDWNVNMTVPTIYMATVSMAAGSSSAQQILTGLTGIGSQGWMIETLAASGIRITCMGSSSSYVTGSTALFDGEPHVIAWVVDVVAGKAKLFTEWGTTELTGLTYTQTGNLICTIGPSSTGAHWSATTQYFQAARGSHALAYANAASVVTTYNTALTTGVEPSYITGLPTTLSEINSVLGLTCQTLYNFGGTTVTPAAGSTGGALAANTGVIHSSTNGTAPTAGASPKIKTSFTTQGATVFDSLWDNLTGTDCMPDGTTPMFAVIVYKMSSSANIKQLLGRTSNSPARGWYIDSTAGDTLRLVIANAGGTATSVPLAGTVGGDGLWHALLVSLPGNNSGSGGTMSALIDVASEVTTTGTIHASAAPNGGYIGCMPPNYTDATPNCYGDPELALVAWATGSQPNATARSDAHKAFRWRYGL